MDKYNKLLKEQILSQAIMKGTKCILRVNIKYKEWFIFHVLLQVKIADANEQLTLFYLLRRKKSEGEDTGNKSKEDDAEKYPQSRRLLSPKKHYL